MKKMRRYLINVAVLVAMLFIVAYSKTAYATTGTIIYITEPLTGTLAASFSTTSGVLSALYDGDCVLSGSEVYTWYKDGTAVSSSKTYTPNTSGSYYCTLKDTNYYSGILTSKTITLYRATGMNMSFDNASGLYEAGDTVYATATIYDGQTIVNWRTSVAGVEIPATGNTVTFAMPAQNVTVTATIKQVCTISVFGGTADKYSAYQGETVTITASDIGNKKFVSWTTTGGRLADPNSRTTTLTLANGNVVVTANFAGETTTVDNSSVQQQQQNNGRATALNAVYTVLDNRGYNVQFYHHTQGPLCDAAFRYAQGNDWLVIDYFNLTVNNSLTTYETPYPLKIQVTIPDDLIVAGRNWRMVCVSRNGQIYSFPDEDANDATITFSPDRFYAYAMCYNDIKPSVEEAIPAEEVYEPVNTEPVNTANTSAIHSVSESRTNASSIHSADASVTTNANSVATPVTNGSTKIKSDQKSAVERADGAQIPLISM